jgi:hypothetical protein
MKRAIQQQVCLVHMPEFDAMASVNFLGVKLSNVST